MDEEARFIKYRRGDISIIRRLQESVMHDAAHGLLFRTGMAVGSRIARNARPYKQQYFEAAKRMLVDEGWAKDILFQNDTITVTSSIETEKGARNTCHMLRGVIAKVYEGYFGKLMTCTEVDCESIGKPKCVFRVGFANNGGKKLESDGNAPANGVAAPPATNGQ